LLSLSQPVFPTGYLQRALPSKVYLAIGFFPTETLHYTKNAFHRCHGLVLLETYTTQSLEEFQANKLPDFLDIVDNVTGDPTHSMYNLSLKEEWLNNKKFCFKLAGNAISDNKNLVFFLCVLWKSWEGLYRSQGS
jgi:hypothetical protein